MYANGGTFKGRVVSWGLTPSKAKATEQFFVKFTVLAQVVDGEEVHCPNSDQTIYRAITDGTIDYVVEDLKHLGFTGTDFSLLDPESSGAHSFEGVEFMARCKHEEYQGKPQERWEFGWVSGEPSKLDKTSVSKLNQRFGAKLKQAMSGNAKPANTSAPAPVKSTAQELEEVL